MIATKNLIDIFNDTDTKFKTRWNEELEVFDNKEVITQDFKIPAFDLLGNEGYISQVDHNSIQEAFSYLHKEYEYVAKSLSFTKTIILPLDLIQRLVRDTRLLYLYQAPDNIYVLPAVWKEKIMKRKRAIGKYGDTPIRSVLLNEAFPDGIVKSYGEATKYTDRVKITLPEAPEEVHAEIVGVINALPTDYAPHICVIADPKSVGTELLLAEKKPAPPSPPRRLDPGIVIEWGKFGAILPTTFYHLSALEYGFLDRVEKVVRKWNFMEFLSNFQS